jgi:PPOX class probable F420-dependent enzyme
MSLKDQVGRMMNRVYDRMRHPDSFKLRIEDAVDGGFETLRGKKYGVVVTFRRSGQSVPSPVWFAIDEAGRAYVGTMRDSGKVKRIRNDPGVLLAPSTVRGKPSGLAVRGVARVLPEDEWPHAEATLAGAYGLGRKIYEVAFATPEELAAYIEIVPRQAVS